MSKKQNVYGEGNYEASRRYYADTKKFIESGKVDAAAREAAPKSPADAAESLLDVIRYNGYADWDEATVIEGASCLREPGFR